MQSGDVAAESATEAKDVGKESKEMLPWGFKDFLYSFLYMLCRVDGLILLFESDGKLKSNQHSEEARCSHSSKF